MAAPLLTCRACGERNPVSSRTCVRCGAGEEQLHAALPLGPWAPLLAIVALLVVLYVIAGWIGGVAPLVWTGLATLLCLAAGAHALARGDLRVSGLGVAGRAARLQGAALTGVGLVALVLLLRQVLA